MAVLSAPSNIPTLDGTTASCVSDDDTGTVYLSVRTDRAWYSVANGDSQGLADADKAVIIAGTTDANIVFAANQAASLDPEQIIDGLPARIAPETPYYLGWVQDQYGPELLNQTVNINPSATNWQTTGTLTVTENAGWTQIEAAHSAGLSNVNQAELGAPWAAGQMRIVYEVYMVAANVDSTQRFLVYDGSAFIHNESVPCTMGEWVTVERLVTVPALTTGGVQLQLKGGGDSTTGTFRYRNVSLRRKG